MTGDIFGEIRLGYLHDGDKVTPVSGGSVSGSMRDFVKQMYLSRESVQYNNMKIPAVTLLKNVTVTGVGE
jgi:PmbA protein